MANDYWPGEQTLPVPFVQQVMETCAKLASQPPPPAGRLLVVNAPGYRVEFHRMVPLCPHCGKEVTRNG